MKKENEIAIIEAIAGKPIPAGKIMAETVNCDLFQDGAAFLENGGQKGPQVQVLTPGMYRINTYMFGIYKQDAIVVPGGHGAFQVTVFPARTAASKTTLVGDDDLLAHDRPIKRFSSLEGTGREISCGKGTHFITPRDNDGGAITCPVFKIVR